MSIGKNGEKDGFVLMCDCCWEETPETFSEFDDAVQYKKQNGWKSQKRNGEWEDICPNCKEGKI